MSLGWWHLHHWPTTTSPPVRRCNATISCEHRLSARIECINAIRHNFVSSKWYNYWSFATPKKRTKYYMLWHPQDTSAQRMIIRIHTHDQTNIISLQLHIYGQAEYLRFFFRVPEFHFRLDQVRATHIAQQHQSTRTRRIRNEGSRTHSQKIWFKLHPLANFRWKENYIAGADALGRGSFFLRRRACNSWAICLRCICVLCITMMPLTVAVPGLWTHVHTINFTWVMANKLEKQCDHISVDRRWVAW